MANFPCTEPGCEAVFGEKRNLKDHLRRKHFGEKFGCSICGFEWSQSNKFYEHRKTQLKCKQAKILTLKPQDGVYEGRQRYAGNLVGDVEQWAAKNLGQAPAQPEATAAAPPLPMVEASAIPAGGGGGSACRLDCW